MISASPWRAWNWLLILSLLSTAAALIVETGLVGPAAGIAILLLAWMKMRLILANYLELATAPFWLRGFNLVIGLYMTLLLVLYLIPEA